MAELQHMHNIHKPFNRRTAVHAQYSIYKRLNGRIAAHTQYVQTLEWQNCSACTQIHEPLNGRITAHAQYIQTLEWQHCSKCTTYTTPWSGELQYMHNTYQGCPNCGLRADCGSSNLCVRLF